MSVQCVVRELTWEFYIFFFVALDIWHLQKTRPEKDKSLNKLIAGKLSPKEVCQQQNPRAELFVTEGITTLVDSNPVQLININFRPIDMILMMQAM